MPLRPSSDLSADLDALKRALAESRRDFAGLWLGDLDGVALDHGDCNLSGACFKDGRFGHARLAGTNLQQGSDLRGACLYGATMEGADLRDADLSGCDLRDTDLRDAMLDGSLLHDALLP